MSDSANGSASGVLEIMPQGGGFLRDPGRSFVPDRSDIFVPQKLIQKLNLSTGAMVVGAVGKGPKGPVLESVETVCGLPPAEFADRTPLKQLTALNPDQRFNLGGLTHRRRDNSCLSSLDYLLGNLQKNERCLNSPCLLQYKNRALCPANT